jgi:hypothetical protein
VKVDYLWSADERVHAINCEIEGASMEAGILCLVSCQDDTIRIANETDAFVVELPKEFRSGSERVKAFNAILNILDHEQI